MAIRPAAGVGAEIGARRLLVGLLLAVLLLVGWGGASGQSEAEIDADAVGHAGLVVRFEDERLTYAWVPFAESSISGLELLRRGLEASDVPLVTVGFGGLGEGVCQIADRGCSAGECRRRVCQGARADDPYWRYFRQTAPGDWRALPLGASGTDVRDGDIDGWSWTGGDAGLPSLDLAEVASLAGAEAVGGDQAVGRTVGGVSMTKDEGAGWATYAGAAGILAVIAGGALMASRRAAERAP